MKIILVNEDQMSYIDSYGLIYTLVSNSLILGTDVSDSPCNANPSKDCSTHLDLPRQVSGYLVTRIGNAAFRFHYYLISVIVPDTVQSLGWDCFAYNTKLTSLTFKEGSQLIRMENGVFFGCTSLRTIRIPSSVNDIRNLIFGRTHLSSFFYCGFNAINSIYVFMDSDYLTPYLPDHVIVNRDYPYSTFGEATVLERTFSCEIPNLIECDICSPTKFIFINCICILFMVFIHK